MYMYFWLHENICFTAVVLLAFNESAYTTPEDGNTVEVCVVLMQAPPGGLERNISVTLGLQDGSKAGICRVKQDKSHLKCVNMMPYLSSNLISAGHGLQCNRPTGSHLYSWC